MRSPMSQQTPVQILSCDLKSGANGEALDHETRRQYFQSRRGIYRTILARSERTLLLTIQDEKKDPKVRQTGATKGNT